MATFKYPKGWWQEQVDKKCCTGAWPTPHVRVTVWNRNLPTTFDRHGKPIGFEWAMGDGKTLAEARRVLLDHIRHRRYGYAGGPAPKLIRRTAKGTR